MDASTNPAIPAGDVRLAFSVRAALDQEFYPETIHTPTSMEFVRDMMLKAKKLGIIVRGHLLQGRVTCLRMLFGAPSDNATSHADHE